MFGFRYKKRRVLFAESSSTKYGNVINIIYKEVDRALLLKENEITFHIIADDKHRIYSFSYANGGMLVLSSGLMEKLLVEIGKDSEKVLFAMEGLLIHEISHIKNHDNIIGEFVKLNSSVNASVRKFFSSIIMGASKVIGIIPIPFWGQIIRSILSKVSFIMDLILEVFTFATTQVYNMLRSTVMQLQEKRCDADIKRCAGENRLPNLFDIIGPYSSFYSSHKIMEEKRLLYISNIPHIDKLKQEIGFRNNKPIISMFGIFIILTVSIFIFSALKIPYSDLVQIQSYALEGFASFYKNLQYYFSYIKRLGEVVKNLVI